MDVLKTLEKLPAECFTTLNSDRKQLICIHRGRSGYTPIREFMTTGQAAICADRLNKKRGVTAKQVQAMEVGSMFGWHVPGADPDQI